jgi:adenylate cyclase
MAPITPAKPRAVNWPRAAQRHARRNGNLAQESSNFLYRNSSSEVEQALAYADESGNVHWSAQLLKLKGDFRQAQAAPDQEVEWWYQQAIGTAQTQHARSLELRAATSLCRLWLRQGRLSDAHQLLSGIYGWFTEGFDTADLKDAGALLNQLKPMKAT